MPKDNTTKRIKISYYYGGEMKEIVYSMNLHASYDSIVKLMTWATKNNVNLLVSTFDLTDA